MTLGAGVTAASLALAFLVRHHGQFYTLTGFVSLPLMLVSSVFAPVEGMPRWLAALAQLNPMTHAMDGARALVVGGGTGEILRVAAGLVLFDVLMFMLAVRAARRATV